MSDFSIPFPLPAAIQRGMEISHRAAHDHNQPIMVHPQVGSLLAHAVHTLKVKRILEIGTLTGTSALWMAAALPADGHIDTCEKSPLLSACAQEIFSVIGYAQSIKIWTGRAEETIQQFAPGTFDLIFVDANKRAYPFYYQVGREKLRSGGLMIFDNTLLFQDSQHPRHQKIKQALHDLHAILKESPDTFHTLSLHTGVTLVCKEGSKGEDILYKIIGIERQ